MSAIVSRGGQTDLAGSELHHLHAPILQVVGGHDPVTLVLNLKFSRALVCEQCLEVVPRATHLFVEQATLQEVARLAAQWFEAHLSVPS